MPRDLDLTPGARCLGVATASAGNQSGQAIVALLQQAANLSNETSDRAMGLARKLALQLHTAEGRINELEADIEQSRDRAARAEKWLTRIYQEIEKTFIHSRQ